MSRVLTEFVEAAIALERAVAALIDPNTEIQAFRDARSLICSALMRSVQVSPLLLDNLMNPKAITIGRCRLVRDLVLAAFGAPGDWGGPIADALRRLYRVDLHQPGAAPSTEKADTQCPGSGE